MHKNTEQKSKSVSKTDGSSVFRQTVENNLNSKLSFQVEDKMRRTMLQNAKVEVKKRNIDNLQSKIISDAERDENFMANKLMRKAARQDTYNKLCYLANV